MQFGARDLTEDDVGRVEIRRVFAWRPMVTVNGRWVWLERVIQRRECILGFTHNAAVFLNLRAPMWQGWRTYTVEQFAEEGGHAEVLR